MLEYKKSISEQGVSQIAALFERLSTAEKILLDEIGEFGATRTYQGPPKYYQNGLIKYRNLGDVLD